MTGDFENRYVNAQELYNNLTDLMSEKKADSIMRLLRDADVVKVVRCRNCEQWDEICGYGNNGLCSNRKVVMHGDDFCSSGEGK